MSVTNVCQRDASIDAGFPYTLDIPIMSTPTRSELTSLVWIRRKLLVSGLADIGLTADA